MGTKTHKYKGYDHHCPTSENGPFVVHYHRHGQPLTAQYEKIIGALDFVMSCEGSGVIFPTKITQGRSLMWKLQEG